MLPPHDPYLQTRDRPTLVAEKPLQLRIWRAAGSPGVALANGQVVAIWRVAKKGDWLLVGMEGFEPLVPAL